MFVITHYICARTLLTVSIDMQYYGLVEKYKVYLMYYNKGNNFILKGILQDFLRNISLEVGNLHPFVNNLRTSDKEAFL